MLLKAWTGQLLLSAVAGLKGRACHSSRQATTGVLQAGTCCCHSSRQGTTGVLQAGTCCCHSSRQATTSVLQAGTCCCHSSRQATTGVPQAGTCCSLVWKGLFLSWMSPRMLCLCKITLWKQLCYVMLFNLLEPAGYVMRNAPTSVTFNNCTLCPHCINAFCIYLRTNSNLCHLQHKLIGFYNRDEKCLQCGTDWVFK